MRSISKIICTTIALVAFAALTATGAAYAQQSPKAAPARAASGAPEGAKCLQCHKPMNPALAEEWRTSAHGQKGVNCYDCHKAEQGRAGRVRAQRRDHPVIVSPKDCARCHQKEVDEQKGSHHAKAGDILASLDNFLGEVLGGPPAVAVGCFQCHGSTVKVLPDGKFDPATWPNTGIGRINPDGSAGSCSACHTATASRRRRRANRKPAASAISAPITRRWRSTRSPSTASCGRRTRKLNTDHKAWKPGVDYTAAPSCATCHMSATRTQGVTHDVGERISWTLRPVVSTKLNMIVFDDLSAKKTGRTALPCRKSATRSKARTASRAR